MQLARMTLSLALLIPVGATVTADGAEVGTVTSAAGTAALAPLMRKVEIGDTVDVGGVSAVVSEPAGS